MDESKCDYSAGKKRSNPAVLVYRFRNPVLLGWDYTFLHLQL